LSYKKWNEIFFIVTTPIDLIYESTVYPGATEEDCVSLVSPERILKVTPAIGQKVNEQLVLI